jgi:hypothetical protein
LIHAKSLEYLDFLEGKMKRKIYILLMVMLYLVFIGCSDPETALSGKIKISFTDATTFANHSYLFTVYPNNETDPGTGAPISDPLAHQIISIDGNGDGEGFAQTFDTSTDCLFGEGTYYIAGIIDMNDNYTVETPYD